MRGSLDAMFDVVRNKSRESANMRWHMLSRATKGVIGRVACGQVLQERGL